jgi:hypothetical protein
MKHTHRIVLSNGHGLLVEEDPQRRALHLASEEPEYPGTVDMYLAEINTSGILVMPNSGDANTRLTDRLGDLPRQVSLERKMQIFLDCKFDFSYSKFTGGWFWYAKVDADSREAWHGPYATFEQMLDAAVDPYITEDDDGE